MSEAPRDTAPADELLDGLRRRAELLAAALDVASIAAWRWDLRTDALEVERPASYDARSGRNAASLTEVLEMTVPEDRDRVAAIVREALRDDEIRRFEFRVLTGAADETRWYASSLRRYLDAAGQPAGLVGATRDATLHKRFDAARSRLRVQAQILDTLTEGVALMDAAGRIQYSNAAFEAMLGRSRGSLSGAAASSLLNQPRANLARAVAAIRAMRQGPGTIELPLRHEGGGVRLVRIAATTAVIDGTEHWIGVLQDVTERKRLEREIIAAANREQERISNDLHDGLGQELTGIALMLKGLQRQLEREAPALAADLDGVLALVNEAIEGTRAIAHGLSPVAVQLGGLAEALRGLVTRADDPAGVRVRYRCAAPPTGPAELSVATHLYRIAQESLTNALRHAGASEIAVSLGASEDRLRLRVVDDGRGLPDDPRTGEGMGFRIMRYRAEVIGAKLRVGRRRRGGTEILVTYPLPAASREPAA